MTDLRIGHGFDIHQLVEGRPCIIGGVTIAHDKGPSGHSDADVLLHALTDAVLGALSWGDIGQWFPNTDPRYRNAASTALLAEVWKKAAVEGWRLVNADTVVLAERPKIGPHLDAMREHIAAVLGATPNQIGIKATTMERLGAIGREEGIAASAVVLLQCVGR